VIGSGKREREKKYTKKLAKAEQAKPVVKRCGGKGEGGKRNRGFCKKRTCQKGGGKDDCDVQGGRSPEEKKRDHLHKGKRNQIKSNGAEVFGNQPKRSGGGERSGRTIFMVRSRKKKTGRSRAPSTLIFKKKKIMKSEKRNAAETMPRRSKTNRDVGYQGW